MMWMDNVPYASTTVPNRIDLEKEIPAMKVFYLKDVEVYNDKVVLTRFTDGSYEKSVCSDYDSDRFDLDTGITICLIKKMLGGSANYHNLLRKVHRLMDQRKKEREKTIEDRRLRREKDERRQAKAREARLSGQAAALLKILRSLETSLNVDEDCQSCDKDCGGLGKRLKD